MANKHYKWVVVALLWGVALLNYLDRQMLSTMKNAIALDISELQSAENFGHLMAVFLWIYGLMSPITGILADRLNRKWLVAGSLFVWSAITLAMGYAQNYTQLYWLRAAMGISEAIYIPAGLSLIADYHSDKTRSLAIGIHMTGLYFGQALGGYGAAAAAAAGWHATFKGFGIVGIIYALILVLALENYKHTSTAEIGQDTVRLGKKLALLLGNVSFLVLLFYFAVPSLPGWAAKNWLPTLLSVNLHMPMEKAGPLATITIAAASFIGVLAGGMLSDRWVQRNVRGRMYTSAIGLTLTIPGLILLGYGHSVYTVVAAAVCFGLGYGMFDANNMPLVCQFVPARSRATAYGIMNMTGVFAGAVITDVLGKSTQGGTLGQSFALLAGIVAAAVIVQLIFLKPKPNV